jgi:hypothetical protein
MKRLPFTDAFVDESGRGRRYLMGCVLAEARHLPVIRPAIAKLAVYERVHFNNESDRQKRVVLSAIAAMPLEVIATIAYRDHGVPEYVARAACLTHIVTVLQAKQVARLVIESRGDDQDDERTIRKARRPEPALMFEHREGRGEPMLWIADAVTWACGAGPSWRSLIDPILGDEVELRP